MSSITHQLRGALRSSGTGNVQQLIDNPANVFLVNNYGGIIFINVGAGSYEAHTQFLEEGRGIKAYHATVDAVRYMFIKTDCMRVISRAKPENVGACQLADKILNLRGQNNGYNYYTIEYQDWVESDKKSRIKGEKFHALVDGITNHDDDETHDYNVGGALLIAESGNALKAQHVYNYWAIASGYEPAIIDSLNPLIMRIGTMRIGINPLEVF